MLGKNYKKWLVALLIVSSLSVVLKVGYGFYFPQNFEECVLAKMKGQSNKLFSVASRACSKQFPSQQLLKEGIYYKKGQLLYSWCETSYSELTFCINKNETDYKITKLEIYVSQKDCELTKDEDLTSYSAEAPLFGNEFKVVVANAPTTKCVYPYWYGVEKVK